MYLSLDYRRDSRLVATQWLNSETSTCVVEFFDFDKDAFKSISKTKIGNEEACNSTAAESLR